MLDGFLLSTTFKLMRYTHLDLFSGIGGFALAAQMLNDQRNQEIIKTKQFVEIDIFCQH